MKRILVPTDGSHLSGEALRAALKLALPFHAEILTLHVVPDPGLPNVVDGVWIDTEGLRRDLRLRGRGLLDEARRELGLATTRPILREACGEPIADVIVQVGEEQDVDLIVMGTHGRAGLDRLLLGSVAERVARTAGAPVMLVREERAHRKFPHRASKLQSAH
jgi:nucleotide-binding universal stress UspA family protein